MNAHQRRGAVDITDHEGYRFFRLPVVCRKGEAVDTEMSPARREVGGRDLVGFCGTHSLIIGVEPVALRLPSSIACRVTPLGKDLDQQKAGDETADVSGESNTTGLMVDGTSRDTGKKELKQKPNA